MAHEVVLAAGAATVGVAPSIGAALTRFTWGDHAVLRPTPAQALDNAEVRACACYPLVPYSNRIRDATLHFAGRTYALARNFGASAQSIHGVGWQRAWDVQSQDSHAVHLTLRHDASDDAQRAAWPWAFDATQTFALHVLDDGSCVLQASLRLVNRSGEPFPFGLGWHPFFPKPSDCTLQFVARGVWRNDAEQLPVALEPIDRTHDFATPRALDDLVLDNVFTGWTGRAALTDPGADVRTVVEADAACSRLVVYAPSGRDFVAIEPVTHDTDAFNRAAAGASGTGMRVLPPGAAFSCTMRLTVGSRMGGA